MDAKPFIALSLAIWLIAPAAMAEVRASVEIGARYFKARDDSLLNPGGEVLELVEEERSAALRLTPYWNWGTVNLRGELWGQLLYQGNDEGDTDFKGIVQELILDWTASPAWILSGGAQVFHWGPGYIWNPANPFTDPEVNNLDRALAYKRDGDPFLAAEWTGEQQAVGLFAFRYDPNDPLYGPNPPVLNSAGIRWQRYFANSDLSVFLANREGEGFASLAASATVSEKLELHLEAAARSRRYTLLPERIVTPAGDFFTLRELDRNEGVFQALVGGQYTFANLTNIILEYFYNGEGYSDGEFEQLLTAAAESERGLGDPILGPAHGGFLGEASRLTGRLRRHYLFARVSFNQLPADLDLRFFLRYGLDDDGLVKGAYLRLPLGESAALQASLQYFGGPKDAETRLIPFRYQAGLAISVDF